MGRDVPDHVFRSRGGKGKKGSGGSGGRQRGSIGGLVILVSALGLSLVGTPVVYLIWQAIA